MKEHFAKVIESNFADTQALVPGEPYLLGFCFALNSAVKFSSSLEKVEDRT